MFRAPNSRNFNEQTDNMHDDHAEAEAQEENGSKVRQKSRKREKTKLFPMIKA